MQAQSSSPAVPDELERYLAQAHIALALADVGDDSPLLRVNEPFHTLTGYAAPDVIGRNCRLLQGDAENPEAREKIHAFLEGDGVNAVRTTILNVRKDGRPFVNLLLMSKLRALSREVRFLFASQFDVSRSQLERLAAYDAEPSRTLSRLRPSLAGAGSSSKDR